MLYSNPEIKHSLTMSFNVLFKDYVRTLGNKTKARTACELASKKHLHQVLLLRKFNARMLLKHIRQVNSLQINKRKTLVRLVIHLVQSHTFMKHIAIC